MLNDSEKGLVKKVSTLENNYVNLSSCMDVLEKGDTPTAEDSSGSPFITHLQNVEKLCDVKTVGSLPLQVSLLESKVDTFVEISEDGEVLLKHLEIAEIKEGLEGVKEDIDALSDFMHLLSKEV